jgi:hypothetical protein
MENYKLTLEAKEDLRKIRARSFLAIFNTLSKDLTLGFCDPGLL